jgi:DNA-directed RNA polymerase beta' subunit
MDIVNIDSLEFSLWERDEIIAHSVCEVTDQSRHPGTPNSSYDLRMGIVKGNGVMKNQRCITCNLNIHDCPGHFGHIILARPVMNDNYISYIVNVLKTVCKECSRILFTGSEEIDLYGVTDNNRFKQVVAIASNKIKECPHCHVPKYSYAYAESQITQFIKDKDKKKNKIRVTDQMVEDIFLNIIDEDIILMGFDPKKFRPINMVWKYFPVIPPTARPPVIMNGSLCHDDLSVLLSSIIKCNQTLKDPKLEEKEADTKYMILIGHIKTYLNNSANRSSDSSKRPYKGLRQRLSGGKNAFTCQFLMGKRVDRSGRTVVTSDPYLDTDQIGIPIEMARNITLGINVQKFNYHYCQKLVNDGYVLSVVRAGKQKNLSHAKSLMRTKLDYGDRVLRRNGTFKYSSKKKYDELYCFEEIPSETAESPCIVENNGKRVVVLSQDGVKNKKGVYYNGMKVEEKMKNGIMYGVNYEVINTHTLINLQNDDLIEHEGVIVEAVRQTKLEFEIQIGDIIRRQVMTGDWVIVNRQPTLHPGSMMSCKVVVHKERTIKMPPSITAPFNCDHDGDELNIHVVQTLEAIAELKEISSTTSNILNGQSSKPMFGLIQDCVLSLYLMTRQDFPVPKHTFNDIIMSIKYYYGCGGNRIYEGMMNRHDELKSMCEAYGLLFYSTRTLLAMCLPSDFRMVNKKVEIHMGRVINGLMTKSECGTMTHILAKFYSLEIGAHCVSNIQTMANIWMSTHSFSIGMEDCLPGRTSEDSNKFEEKISRIIYQSMSSARSIEVGTVNVAHRELRTLMYLNQSNNEVQSIAISDKNNCFFPMIDSKCKGTPTNVAQIKSTLGQQNIAGKRDVPLLNNGKRTLSHYDYEVDLNDPDIDLIKYYESRGNIVNSYFKGLNMREFWMHMKAGRVGICDTALKTAQSGYIEKRMVKFMEHLSVYYDRTVRTTSGLIVQYIYGGHGFEPSRMIQVNGKLQFTDISHIANRVNDQHTNDLLNDSEEFPIPLNEKILDGTDIKFAMLYPSKINEFIIRKKNEEPLKLIQELNSQDNNSKRKLTSSEIKSIMNSIVPFKTIFPKIGEYNHKRILKDLKHQIEGVEIYHEKIEEFKLLINKDYVMSQIPAGDMVGVKAAQFLSEQVTQLTLNTFHATGQNVAAVTSGLKRIDELLNMTRNQKQRNCQVYFKAKPQTFEDMRELVSNKLKQTTLTGLTKSYKVKQNPSPEEWYESCEILYSDDYKNYEWCVCYTLNNEAMYSARITLTEIAEKIMETFQDLRVMYGNNTLHVYIYTEALVVPDGISYEDTLKHYIYDIAIKRIGSLVLSGVPNIIEIYPEKTEDGECFYNTKGSNLAAFLGIDIVDSKRTTSNDLWDVYITLGRSAIKNWLKRQLKSVLSSDGAYVNPSHIRLLVDKICYNGIPKAISRHGIDINEVGVMSKISFEEPHVNFIKASVNGMTDDLKCVSGSTATGKVYRKGTGICDILMDLDMLNISKESFDVTKKQEKRKQDITIPTIEEESIIDLFPDFNEDDEYDTNINEANIGVNNISF